MWGGGFSCLAPENLGWGKPSCLRLLRLWPNDKHGIARIFRLEEHEEARTCSSGKTIPPPQRNACVLLDSMLDVPMMIVISDGSPRVTPVLKQR